MKNSFSSYLKFICVLFGLGAVILPARAADSYLVKMAATTWEPFIFLEGDIQKGIDYEIARKVEKKLGLPLMLRQCPFKRCLIEMSQGLLDMQSGIAYNDERAKYMIYLKPAYGQVSARFYTRKGEGHLLKRYEDLYKIRVGMVAASHYFEPFNSDTHINKFAVAREDMLFALLEKGRVDAIIGTSPNLEFQIKKFGLKDKFTPAPYKPDGEIPVYFAISKQSALISRLDQLNDIMAELKESGEIDKILEDYR